MQIHNFYSDPVPSVRNPLDCIVLSPHTIKASELSLADMAEDSSDYQSLLPSICSCEYHDQNACAQPKFLLNCVQNIFYRLSKCREPKKDRK